MSQIKVGTEVSLFQILKTKVLWMGKVRKEFQHSEIEKGNIVLKVEIRNRHSNKHRNKT